MSSNTPSLSGESFATFSSEKKIIRRAFTVSSGQVDEGIKVEKFSLKGAQIEIPAVIIGDEGRGRNRGVLPVALRPDQYEKWKLEGKTTLLAAEIGLTKTGKPKLFEKLPEDASPEELIVVFRTMIGYRGGNSHTGDRTETTTKNYWGDEIPVFHPFPGRILAEGTVAQGNAGRMGSGDQMVAVVPKRVVFRTGYTGRLYGKSAEHYYLWDGQCLRSATWEERIASDIF